LAGQLNAIASTIGFQTKHPGAKPATSCWEKKTENGIVSVNAPGVLDGMIFL